MGAFAEDAAREYQFTREQQDAYALESLARAQKAIGTGAFEREVVGIEVKTRKGVETVSIDEQPGKAQHAKIPTLKPAFFKQGTIPAANHPSLPDGSAAPSITPA